jgi:hypothetical protein
VLVTLNLFCNLIICSVDKERVKDIVGILGRDAFVSVVSEAVALAILADFSEPSSLLESSRHSALEGR